MLDDNKYSEASSEGKFKYTDLIPENCSLQKQREGFANDVFVILDKENQPISVIKSYQDDTYFRGEQLMHSSSFVHKPQRDFVDNERKLVIMEYVHSSKETAVSMSQLAHLLADLHHASYDREQRGNTSIQDFLSENGGISELESYIPEDAFAELTKAQQINFPEHRLIHGDIDRTNLVESEKGLYLIDFDEVQINSIYFEFGMIYLSTNLLGVEDVRIENFKELISDYSQISGIKIDQSILLNAIKLMSAKFYDWRLRHLGLDKNELIQSAQKELIEICKLRTL